MPQARRPPRAAEADALFTFLTHPDVDATNWRAEQAIRPAVVNRKVWGGNRTWRGAATQSRIMSVLRTAVQQGVDPIAYLAQLARAPQPGRNVPSSPETGTANDHYNTNRPGRAPLSKYAPIFPHQCRG